MDNTTKKSTIPVKTQPPKIDYRYVEMCNTCGHRYYCGGAYKKDCWCGNHCNR